jgi:hypothetical protein
VVYATGTCRKMSRFAIDLSTFYVLYIQSLYRTETELKIRNEIERKMQDIQPNVEQ